MTPCCLAGHPRRADSKAVAANAVNIDPDQGSPVRARIRAGGFSLIELLVVVFIIGLFAGAAVLSLNVVGDDRDLERETFRLRSLLDTLMDEAVLQTRDYGVLFTRSGYRFLLRLPDADVA